MGEECMIPPVAADHFKHIFTPRMGRNTMHVLCVDSLSMETWAQSPVGS